MFKPIKIKDGFTVFPGLVEETETIYLLCKSSQDQ
jgi:hypothetical protein